MKLSKEEINKEIKELKQIVSDVFNVDISNGSRDRNFVDARKVYSKILRERGYVYVFIANTIGKNHSTIHFYVQDIEHMLKFNKDIIMKYIACKDMFFTDLRGIVVKEIKKDTVSYVTIVRLTKELQESNNKNKQKLIKFVEYIEEYKDKNRFFPSIDVIKNDIIPLFK